MIVSILRLDQDTSVAYWERTVKERLRFWKPSKRTDLSGSRFLPRIGGNSFREKRSFLLAADLLIAGGNLHA